MSVNSFCEQLSEIQIEEVDIIEKKKKREIISDSNVGYSSKTAKRYLDRQNEAKGDYEWFFRAGSKALEIDEVVMYNLIEDYLKIEEQTPVTLEVYQEKLRPAIEEYKGLYKRAREQALANTKLGQNIIMLSRLIKEQHEYIPQMVALYNVFYNFTPQMQAFFETYMEMLEKNSADSINAAEINDKIDNLTEYEASKTDYEYLFIMKEMLCLPLKKLEEYYKILCNQGYFENRITISDFRNEKVNANWLGCILNYYRVLSPKEQNDFFYIAVKFTYIKDKQSVVKFMQAY